MCKNIIRSGNRMLLSVLKHPDLINHLDRKMTKEMLLFLYSNIPKGAQILNSLNTRSSMQGFPELDLQMINQVNIILKSQLQIKGCYYKLTVEEKMTYRDLFVWYLLTEQTEPAFHIWMYSNVLPIWDALLCSFILDGMKHIIYGQKTITLFKHLSREYVQHSTNILHECYINEEYPDSKDIVEHVLFEKPYEIFLHAYNKKKEIFLHHRSITDIIYRRWYGNRLHGTQSPKVVKIVQAVLFFLILPFCLLLLPFLALFKEEFLRRIMNSYNTAFIKCCYFNVSYTAFMCALTVTVLSGVSDPFSWTDLMLLVWSACFALDEGRQIVAAQGNGIGEKFRAYIDWRNTVDLANVILFFIGMILKYFNVSYLARVILVANLLLFFLRILDLTSVSRRLGVTYVVVKTLITGKKKFIICVQIVRKESDSHKPSEVVTIIDNAMGKQYWIMYGDNNVDDFDTSDSKISVRLVPYLRGTAALIFFVLLFNTLIAMFTDRYQKIITQSKMHWLYNFVELIDDYEEKPILPPPFVMLFTPHMLLFGLMWCFTIPFQSCSDPRHKHSLKILTRIFCKCRLRNLKRGSDFFVKFYLSSAVKHKPQFTEKRIHNILSEIKKKYIHRWKKSDMTRKR
ncbi:transient receptor potential cation channel subfamily M member 2-like [Saccostrea cucullata]|uniref:transient receptor potential cation channel subfamily M member 2-like n=1 Tax=Saccostrea cuccullata TaxID=36930 RepID=UPI002ED043FE